MATVSAAMPQKTGQAAARPAWYGIVKAYEKPILSKAIWQLVNTFVPYLLLWALAVYTIQASYSYWVTLPIVAALAALLVRIFIFFHDCGHGSFFASRKANMFLGYITGVLTFTPYEEWRHSHGIHHATAGDLDRRGVGDVWTMTVEEYLSAPSWKRFAYWFFRQPFVLLVLGPPSTFIVSQRFTKRSSPLKSKLSVHITNVALLAILALAHFTIGLRTYLLIKIPAFWIAGALGIWLFYVQHQFEGVYWARHKKWDVVQSALAGSSFYRLPRVLQWISGNIGFHHIHHVRARIPNYRLEEAYHAVPELQQVKPLTLKESLKSLRLNLWDERAGTLISFRELKRLPARRAAG